jgi:hypothetical protein
MRTGSSTLNQTGKSFFEMVNAYSPVLWKKASEA